MGINWRQHFGGRFINADSLGTDGDVWTIDSVHIEAIEDPDGKGDRHKLVIYFGEHTRGFVPSKTAAACIGAMFGDDTDDWVGKRVHLYKDARVKVGGRTVGGVRVKGSPDIEKTMRVKIQVTARRRAEEHTLEKTPDACPLRLTLESVGLTVDQYDAWAASVGRAPVAQSDAATREKAAAWLAGDGAAAVRKAVGGEA